jgi:hypothetical protein
VCRRRVFDICFDNAAADSDHHDCDSDSEQGCVRCHVTGPVICCDIHNLTAFAEYESYIPKPPRPPQPSRLPRYTKDEHDREFQEALHDWRELEEKTKDVYGWACLKDYGPCLIMPNAILDRIVDCVHHRKIQTPQDLKRETGWTESERFWDDIVMLIQGHATPLLISERSSQD